jgi:hypothetical protein
MSFISRPSEILAIGHEFHRAGKAAKNAKNSF